MPHQLNTESQGGDRHGDRGERYLAQKRGLAALERARRTRVETIDAVAPSNE
jgi:hypothetical protein